jgi:hypothetical protein
MFDRHARVPLAFLLTGPWRQPHQATRKESRCFWQRRGKHGAAGDSRRRRRTRTRAQVRARAVGNGAEPGPRRAGEGPRTHADTGSTAKPGGRGASGPRFGPLPAWDPQINPHSHLHACGHAAMPDPRRCPCAACTRARWHEGGPSASTLGWGRALRGEGAQGPETHKRLQQLSTSAAPRPGRGDLRPGCPCPREPSPLSVQTICSWRKYFLRCS